MLHEGGHLVVAKINKVHVNTFSVGFGWRIIGFKFWKRAGTRLHVAIRLFNFKPFNKHLWNCKYITEYRIAPFLLGGFCAMGGETKSTGQSTDLVSKKYSQKVAVALAGVAVNFVTGFLAIYAVVASKVGFLKGIVDTFKYLGLIFEALWFAVYKLCIGQGQITTASETAKIMTGLSWEMYLIFFGVFSIALGVFNLLPFPALDGSLPFLWLAEKWHKNCQVIVHWLIRIGFIILMILQLVILFFWAR